MRIPSLSAARRAAAVAALLAASLWAQHADAGRKAAAPRPTIAGARVKAWKAKGTRFEHETLRMHGNIVHWERRAAGAKGTTKVTGKTWGSSYKGHQWQSGGKTLRKVTVKGTDGSKRQVWSVTEKNGTTRQTITGLPGGITRRITTWTAGKTQMTATRDYDASGTLVKSERTGHKKQD